MTWETPVAVLLWLAVFAVFAFSGFILWVLVHLKGEEKKTEEEIDRTAKDVSAAILKRHPELAKPAGWAPELENEQPFPVPPVCTDRWTEDDWNEWRRNHGGKP